jgi:hypothetical protein
MDDSGHIKIQKFSHNSQKRFPSLQKNRSTSKKGRKSLKNLIITNIFELGLLRCRDDVPEGMDESVMGKLSPFMEALRLTSVVTF